MSADLQRILNLVGLSLVTLGALDAIAFSPAPTYYNDGRVGLGPGKKQNEDEDGFRRRRIRMHYYQKWGVRSCFGLIAAGSVLQACAVW